jgi:hypothetical protein
MLKIKAISSYEIAKRYDKWRWNYQPTYLKKIIKYTYLINYVTVRLIGAGSFESRKEITWMKMRSPPPPWERNIYNCHPKRPSLHRLTIISRAGIAQSVWRLGYGLDVRGSTPDGGWEFFSSTPCPTGSGAHPVSYPMGTEGSFPGSKAARAWSWPVTSIYYRGQRMGGVIPPLPLYVFMVWCRKRRLKWVTGAWGYNWATLPLRDINNTEAWSSRLGAGLGANNPTL